ncbi:phosphotransferase family protein [soil metagenome]
MSAAAAVADADETADVDTAAIARGIEKLLTPNLPGVTSVHVDHVKRVFGGNARTAWACEGRWRDSSGVEQREDLILLTRIEGSQVQTDPEWEFGVLSALTGQHVRAPRAWAHDTDGTVFGTASVLLERVSGSADAVAFLKNSNTEEGRELTLDLARATAELHSAQWRTGGLGPLLGAVHSAEVARSPRAQVEHWHGQFESSRLEPHPVLTYLFGWLTENLPDPVELTIVHGDLRPGNFLYEGASVVALLDWEMAHIGDPVEDIAWAYRALWSPERFVSAEDFVAEYERAGGPEISRRSLLYYRVFSEVKFATISLQAARAFIDGSSTSVRLLDRARTVIPALQRSLGWVRELSAGDSSESDPAASAHDERIPQC